MVLEITKKQPATMTEKTFLRVLRRIQSYAGYKKPPTIEEAEQRLTMIAGMAREVMLHEGFSPEEE